MCDTTVEGALYVVVYVNVPLELSSIQPVQLGTVFRHVFDFCYLVRQRKAKCVWPFTCSKNVRKPFPFFFTSNYVYSQIMIMLHIHSGVYFPVSLVL